MKKIYMRTKIGNGKDIEITFPAGCGCIKHRKAAGMFWYGIDLVNP